MTDGHAVVSFCRVFVHSCHEIVRIISDFIMLFIPPGYFGRGCNRVIRAADGGNGHLDTEMGPIILVVTQRS